MATEVSTRLTVALIGLAAWVLLAGRAAAPASGNSRPEGQVSADSGRWAVSLRAAEACRNCPSGVAFVFEARDKLTAQVTRFRLANETSRIDEVRIVGPGGVVVVGRFQRSSVVTIVGLPGGHTLDTFLCGEPVFSPDDRLLAFLKWAPAHFPPDVGASEEYLAYDLTRNADYNRANLKAGVRYDAGWAVYPPGATNAEFDNILRGSAVAGAHAIVSPLAWLDGRDTFAFVDRCRGVNRLILADVREGVRHPRVRAFPLDASQLVDLPSCKTRVAPSDFEKWSEEPGSLVLVDHMEIPDGERDVLRLRFSPQPCLARATLDIPLGELAPRH